MTGLLPYRAPPPPPQKNHFRPEVEPIRTLLCPPGEPPLGEYFEVRVVAVCVLCVGTLRWQHGAEKVSLGIGCEAILGERLVAVGGGGSRNRARSASADAEPLASPCRSAGQVPVH